MNNQQHKTMTKKIFAGALLPLIALGLFTTPALAHGGWNSGDDVNVNNNNNATVSNGVLVIANSGGNTADGSSGGDGGNGGDVGYDGCNNECDNEVDDGNTGGNGGDGGTEIGRAH